MILKESENSGGINSKFTTVVSEQNNSLTLKVSSFILPPYCQEECQIIKISPVRQQKIHIIFEFLSYILTGGILFIITRSFPSLRLKLYFQVVSPQESEGVFVEGLDGVITLLYFLTDIYENHKVFQYRYQRYILKDNYVFESYGESAFNMNNNEIFQLSRLECPNHRILKSYERNGKNETDIKDNGLLVTCFNELLSPFYIFQSGSCILWLYEEYFIYSYVIIGAIIISFISKIFSKRMMPFKLNNANIFRQLVTVQRKGAQFKIPNNEIIFGDVIFLNQGEVASCDLIVLSGCATVNESILTGDSFPITKYPLPNVEEKFIENKQFIIYCGSLIESQLNLKCIAFRLGFETMRGNVIRSIMFPKKKTTEQFKTDTVYFILIMVIASIISFFVTLQTLLDKLDQNLISKKDIILRCLDLVTISVPPVLPLCLNLGIAFTIQRLKRQNIFCFNQNNIHSCGVVRTVCLDKTGTLTEEKVYFKMVSEYRFQESKFIDSDGNSNLGFIPRLITGACHDVKLRNDKYSGDPLDLEMFKNSGCQISKKSIDQLFWEGYGVIKEIFLHLKLSEECENIVTSEKMQEGKRYSTKFSVDDFFKDNNSSFEKRENLTQSVNNSDVEPINLKKYQSEMLKVFQVKNNDIKMKNTSKHSEEDEEEEEEKINSNEQRSEKNLPILLRVEKETLINLNQHIEQELDKKVDIKMNENLQNMTLHKQDGISSIKNISQFDQQSFLTKYDKICINLLKIFPFDPKSQRMSCLIRISGRSFIISKGSPEMMKKIFLPKFLPCEINNNIKTYDGKLKSLTRQGLRVLALGYREIGVYDIGKPRKKLEVDLIFSGFLVFENQLKQETTQNIKNLIGSSIQVKMVTGDNPLTSLNIGMKCHLFRTETNILLLDYQDKEIICDKEGEIVIYQNIQDILEDKSVELVVTGDFFTEFFTPNSTQSNIPSIRDLLFMTKIFSRMNPKQKQILVNLLQSQSNQNNYSFIGVCGDGSNDFQALKASDMGVLFGETENFVAATFTSKVININIIEIILREGRCCLVNSFQCFKFMALYSSIQVCTTAIMHIRGVVPSEYQFQYWDLFIVLPLSFLMGFTEPSQKLSHIPPSHRLFSPQNVVSVCGLGLIQLTFLIISIELTQKQSWYIDPITYQYESGLDPAELLMNSFDNTVLFWISNMQYLGSLVAISIASIHKKPFYTNIYFASYMIIIFSFSVFLLFTTNYNIIDFFQIYPQLTHSLHGKVIAKMDYNYRFVILSIIIVNLFVTFAFENLIVQKIVSKLEQIFPSLVFQGVISQSPQQIKIVSEETQQELSQIQQNKNHY